MALIIRPTACAQAGIHDDATVTTSDTRKVSKGKDFMRSRHRQRSWQTAAVLLAGLIAFTAPAAASSGSGSKLLVKPRSGNQGPGAQSRKLDTALKALSGRLSGTSKVIIRVIPGQEANAGNAVKALGGRVGRQLKLIDGVSAELPNQAITRLAERSEVVSIHLDRPIAGHMSRTAVSTGARAAQTWWGYDGAGVGVAVIDSGISGWHDDLGYTGYSSKVRVVNGQRVTAFVDFVNGQFQKYDDNGHGTHVAGIIAGNGYDSYGAHAGIAP
jgi:subtilisin family serine protease